MQKLRYQVRPKGLLPRAAAVFALGAGFIFLVGPLLVTNLVQTSSVLVLPFSRRAFRRINRSLAQLWWGWPVLWCEKILGLEIRLFGDSLPKRENAILISNHQEISDIPILLSLAAGKGRLGDMKWFVKNPVKCLPGPGWGMLFLDCLFVTRNWTEDQERIDRIFRRYKKGRFPFWLVSFCEGTRITEKKRKASQKFSQERGLPVFENVLCPRVKGFSAAMVHLRGRLDAVYDVTIGFPAGIPTFWQLMSGMAPTVCVHVKRIPVREVPVEEDEVKTWLLERFVEKDRLMAHFLNKDEFPGLISPRPTRLPQLESEAV